MLTAGQVWPHWPLSALAAPSEPEPPPATGKYSEFWLNFQRFHHQRFFSFLILAEKIPLFPAPYIIYPCPPPPPSLPRHLHVTPERRDDCLLLIFWSPLCHQLLWVTLPHTAVVSTHDVTMVSVPSVPPPALRSPQYELGPGYCSS